MKLLSKRKKLCDEGKIKMCLAEYDGSWLPYKQPFENVTYDWLLEELTYDDCDRKNEIISYMVEFIERLEREKSNYHELKENLSNVFKHII
jgi:hypothetical protein